MKLGKRSDNKTWGLFQLFAENIDFPSCVCRRPAVGGPLVGLLLGGGGGEGTGSLRVCNMFFLHTYRTCSFSCDDYVFKR